MSSGGTLSHRLVSIRCCSPNILVPCTNLLSYNLSTACGGCFVAQQVSCRGLDSMRSTTSEHIWTAWHGVRMEVGGGNTNWKLLNNLMHTHTHTTTHTHTYHRFMQMNLCASTGCQRKKTQILFCIESIAWISIFFLLISRTRLWAEAVALHLQWVDHIGQPSYHTIPGMANESAIFQ